MAKIKLTKELIEKAALVFRENKGKIVTGQGLSRKELRVLWRAKIINMRYRKYKKTGQLICEWIYNPSI